MKNMEPNILDKSEVKLDEVKVKCDPREVSVKETSEVSLKDTREASVKETSEVYLKETSEVSVKVECEDDEIVRCHQRENRLTSIIDQLRCQSQMKGNALTDAFNFTDNGEGGGGGSARRYARDAAASPAHAPPTATTAHQTSLKSDHQTSLKNDHQAVKSEQTNVKSERLSPHDSNASRSRSVTPSTSSYPGTPPERGSPHQQPAAHPPRNYSDIMRSLAARYNHPGNDYFHRLNGFAPEPRTVTSPASDGCEAPLGGLFTKLAKQQGGPARLPAFPVMLDMSSTKALLAITRVTRGGRSRRKRAGLSGPATEHSPLDLSAAGESAAKRARLSASPSDSDERDGTSNDDRSECLCAEARARLSAWTVDDVCDFVNSIDICAEYASNFREQRIDGSGLPLLTEDHLTGMLQMKLGPALKLRAVLSRRLEACASCQANSATVGTAPAVSIQNNISSKLNGAVKPEPRSNTTSPS